jgi:hypothetical protein
MWNPISSFGGHLGADVSALVDGQLDADAAERAWAHVLHCPPCRRLVEREGWVKRQVTLMAARPLPEEQAPERLLGSLYGLLPDADRPLDDVAAAPEAVGSTESIEAWRAVDDLERRGRGRRRAGLAIAGVGSVSAAVLGISALSGAPLGIGNAPTGTPATVLSRGSATALPTRTVAAPTAAVHGRLPGWAVTRDADGVAHAVAVADDHR